jgi:hypothetical protein
MRFVGSQGCLERRNGPGENDPGAKTMGGVMRPGCVLRFQAPEKAIDTALSLL